MENSKISYYHEPDPILNGNNCLVLERVKRELAGKQYFSDEVYAMYLDENGLDSSATYNKDTMQKGMLQTVYDILNSLAGDIELYRSVDAEFGTTSEAMKNLETRMYNLQKRILSIPDEPCESNIKSPITFLYHN